MMNDTTQSAGDTTEPAGETAPKAGAKLHILGRRNGAFQPEAANPEPDLQAEDGEIPFEDDEALLEEALLAEEAEAEASLDEEQ